MYLSIICREHTAETDQIFLYDKFGYRNLNTPITQINWVKSKSMYILGRFLYLPRKRTIDKHAKKKSNINLDNQKLSKLFCAVYAVFF